MRDRNGKVAAVEGVAHDITDRKRAELELIQEKELSDRIYENSADARTCLTEFEARYNERRPRWALVPDSGGDLVTPLRVYEGKVHGVASHRLSHKMSSGDSIGLRGKSG